MDSNPSSSANDRNKSSSKYDSQSWNEFLKPSKLDSGAKEVSHEDEYSDAKDADFDILAEFDELDLDDESISSNHKDLSEYKLQKLRDEASCLKNEGNDRFKKSEYKEAVRLYTKALNSCPLKFESDRSILYANRAAARISLDMNDDAVLDCNKAIELNPNYLRAILRRAQLHRKMENLEKSLEDYQRVAQLDCNNAEARAACTTLPPEIHEKNEKLKTEMFGKLKELGNMCLKPFGLSTNNFKVVQDPNTGGYSVNFEQNKS